MSYRNSHSRGSSRALPWLAPLAPFSPAAAPAFAQQVETVTVTAERLAAARNGIQTQTGASTYTVTAADIRQPAGRRQYGAQFGDPAGAGRGPGFLRPAAYPRRA